MFTVNVHGDKLILVDHYYFDISLRIIVMNVLLSRRREKPNLPILSLHTC